MTRFRRVKCDETRPSCRRCISYNGVCSGYVRLDLCRVEPRKKPLQIAPKLKYWFEQISYPPSTAVFKTAREQRYLSIFCTKTAVDLKGYFEGDIWTRLVAQVSQADPSIRHAVVAIVAASFLCYRKSSLPWIEDQRKEHEQFALKHYGIAIKELRDAVAQGTKDLQKVLISAFVIICFENMFGSVEFAVAQTNAALKLMYDSAQNNREDQLDDDLVTAFLRLDIQNLTFKDNRSSESHLSMESYWKMYSDETVPKFVSVDHGKDYFILLLQRALHFVARINGGSFWSSQMNQLIPESHRPQMKAYGVKLQQWKESYQPFLDAPVTTHSDREYLVVLSIHLHACALELYTSVSLDEVQNIRKYMFLFEKMVQLAKTILSHRFLKEGDSLFTAEIQYIVSVFVCAIRCPHGLVRREAIALLRQNPRREGLWDSILAANVAEVVMNFEEESEMDGVYVRQEELLKHFDFDIDTRKREVLMRCYMPVTGTAEVVLRKAVVSW